VKSASEPCPVKALPYLPNYCPQIIAFAFPTDFMLNLLDPNFKAHALEKLVNIPNVNSFRNDSGLHANIMKLLKPLIGPKISAALLSSGSKTG
jgi:hypothetical protein